MKRIPLQEIINIHKEAVAISNAYRKDEIGLIRIIQKVDEFKVYRSYKYKSLYQYTILSLKLSEHQSYTFINVARKARSLKALDEAIARGSVSVSKARRIVPVINHQNAADWIRKAETFSQKHLERAVAKVSPRSTVNEGAHYISESMLELRVAISEETERMLKRVQDVSSQKNKKHRGLEEVLREMARNYLEKYDPVLRAKRAIGRELKKDVAKEDQTEGECPLVKIDVKKSANSASIHETSTAPTEILQDCSPENEVIRNSNRLAQDKKIRRERLPRTTIHLVNLRDEGQCQSLEPDGSKCKSSKWTDIHHLHPVSLGGSDHIENLISVCRNHHLLIHESDFR